MSFIAPIFTAVATLASSFMSKPSAPSAPSYVQPAPTPPPPEPEPTIEPEGAADQEAARLRSIKRRQEEQARGVTSLEEEKTTSKTLLGS